MPRPLRITQFFTMGNTGWSETHYDLLSQTLSQAVQVWASTMVSRRKQMLASGPYMQYVRASYDDTFRDSQVIELPAPRKVDGYYVNNVNWSTVLAGEAWTAALARGQSGDLYRKQIYLSGGPFSDDYYTSVPNTDLEFTQAFIQYASGLVSGGYGFPVWQRDVQTYPIRPITAISPTPPYTLTVPNHGITTGPGKSVFLSKMGYFGQIGSPKWKPNGRYSIISVPTADTVVLGGFTVPTTVSWVSGFAQFQVKSVVPYTSVVLEGFTHRKRGRPFDSPRGRSRRRTTYSIV